MEVIVENQKIDAQLLRVPTMNYGQMKRWSDFVPLPYVIKVPTEEFIGKTSVYFSKFRDSEIKEDDPEGFPELVAFKEADWPNLNELIKAHTSVLVGLIIFNEYDILHLIVDRLETKSNYYYSANSIDEVIIDDGLISLKGICFKSDYVEHTFNYIQPRKYAKLKSTDETN